MFDSGMVNIIVFFVAAGICLIFVITWIFKSERTMDILRDEIEGLKEHVESSEREKSVLLERLEDLEETSSLDGAYDKGDERTKKRMEEMAKEIAILESENENLRAELDETKASLEEVYKAVYGEGVKS